MRWRWYLASLLVGLSLTTGTAHSATHYLSGKSSVDGSEIAWGGKTTYAAQCALGTTVWNALGKISITPDTAWTIEDLTYIDTSSRIYTWYAAWGQRVGSDGLWMNTYNSSGLTATKLQSVCTHELGHALGLDHSIVGNVMYKYSWDIILGAQDTSDYSYLYP